MLSILAFIVLAFSLFVTLTCVTLGVTAHYVARNDVDDLQKIFSGDLLRASSMAFNPTWSDLHAFGKSRLLRTTYFWIAVIPVTAKLLHAVEETLSFTVFNTQITLTLALPFPWTMFFYGSVLAALASTIYMWRCPRFLQLYPSYAEFAATGGTGRQLSCDFAAAIQAYEKKVTNEHLRKQVESFVTLHCNNPDRHKEQIAEIDQHPWKASLTIAETEIKDSQLAAAFWTVRQFLELQSKASRVTCCGLFYLAFSFFLTVFLFNIWYVISWQMGWQK
jgi:hypothetical protein